MSIINNENIEEWLFDYCEGNLTAIERQDLEFFLQKNPDYKADLKYWQSSILKEESVPTTLSKAAAQLLKSDKVGIKPVYLFDVIFIIVACLAIFFSASDANTYDGHKDFQLVVKPHVASKSLEKNQTVQREVAIIQTTDTIEAQQKGKGKAINANEEPTKIGRTLEGEWLQRDFYIEPESSDINIILDSISEVNITEPVKPLEKPQKRELTKKQKRHLNKIMRRAHAERRAEEFMRGEEPYVVPIDPNLF